MIQTFSRMSTGLDDYLLRSPGTHETADKSRAMLSASVRETGMYIRKRQLLPDSLRQFLDGEKRQCA
jgi:hypothetical protein